MMYLFRHCQPIKVNLPDNFSVDQHKSKLKDLISNNKLMANMWQNISPELQNILTISFTYRQVFDQVLNIEIKNWHELFFIENEFNKINSNIFWQKYRVMGGHLENIRFENIHFATDLIDGKTVYQIHWDKYSPSSLVKAIKHKIFD